MADIAARIALPPGLSAKQHIEFVTTFGAQTHGNHGLIDRILVVYAAFHGQIMHLLAILEVFESVHTLRLPNFVEPHLGHTSMPKTARTS
jgi:hypothetical protein